MPSETPEASRQTIGLLTSGPLTSALLQYRESQTLRHTPMTDLPELLP